MALPMAWSWSSMVEAATALMAVAVASKLGKQTNKQTNKTERQSETEDR